MEVSNAAFPLNCGKIEPSGQDKASKPESTPKRDCLRADHQEYGLDAPVKTFLGWS